MDPLQSSQSFVRALKAFLDPPYPGSPSKIEIARQAWDDAAFYVPSKGEIITDWILSSLLKEKGHDPCVICSTFVCSFSEISQRNESTSGYSVLVPSCRHCLPPRLNPINSSDQNLACSPTESHFCVSDDSLFSYTVIFIGQPTSSETHSNCFPMS
jgi:hypothetical protein